MRLSKVELHEFVKTGEGELHSRVIDASDSLTIEDDPQARRVWFLTDGKPRRFTPYENVRYGDEAPGNEPGEMFKGLARSLAVAAEGFGATGAVENVESLLSGKFSCTMCGRAFETHKSLMGHMSHCGKQRGKLGGGTGK